MGYKILFSLQIWVKHKNIRWEICFIILRIFWYSFLQFKVLLRHLKTLNLEASSVLLLRCGVVVE